MKKKIFPLILLFMLILNVVWAANGPNLIPNSSAEFNSTAGLTPDNWDFSGSGNVIYGVDDTQSHSGNYSLIIDARDGTAGGGWQTDIIPLQTGPNLEFGFHYKASGFTTGGKIGIYLYRFDSANRGWWHKWHEFDCANGDNWVSFPSTASMSQDTTGVRIRITIIQGPGTLWVDDVWLNVINGEIDSTPPNSPSNLLASRQAPNCVKLSWQNPGPASDGDLPSMYKIYRSRNSGVELIEDNLVSEISGTKIAWYDYQVLDDVRYYYILVGMDKMGQLVESKEVVASSQVKYGDNVVTNGSFEAWDDISTPTGWRSMGKEGATKRDDLVKKEGNYSLKITNSQNTEYNYVDQWKSIKSNTNYTMVGWIKGENIEIGPNGQGARFFTTLPGVSSKSFSGTFDWQEIRVTFNSGNNTSIGLVPYLHLSTGTVWFDGLGIYDSIDGIVPEPPTNFNAVRVNGTKKVEFSWGHSPKAPDGDLATKYIIYRGTTSEQLDFMVELSSSSLSWVDTEASGDMQLYYSIIAIDKAGNESEPCIAFVEKMGSIRGRIISEVDSMPLEGATIAIEGTGFSTKATTDGMFEFNLLLADNYSLYIRNPFYQRQRVQVELAAGEVKELGNITLEWDDIKPNEPKNLVADGDSYVGLIQLTWDEPIPASDEEIADSYNIYRSTSENVKRVPDQLIATVKEPFWRDIIDAKYYGHTFYYFVESIDGAENISEETSNVASATAKAPPIPELVSPLNRELFVDKAPEFTWKISEIPDDLIGFTIQLSTSPDFATGRILDEDCGIQLAYIWLEELEQGLWYWRVRSLFNTGIKSSWSEVGNFVTTKLEQNTSLVPYINLVPSVFRGDSVKICYLLTNEARVTLKIFNVGGKLVDSFTSPQGAGYYEWPWEGKDNKGKELPNGLYIIQLNVNATSGDNVRVMKKLVIYR